ncbi:antibiotic biosynthesis monooxygenase family protein [Pseudonocardia sp. CA-142604]|uniref:antibiotic biosynthesis monooxygenase family protein n=1 Tax=Pseudonocardia sp. CA-142604 TaxID=3240024 RepID=UPI003D8CC3D7
MFARYTTLRGDRDKIEAAIEYVDGEVRAAVEATPGNVGFGVAADPASGLLIGASYWDSRESMTAGESALAESRERAAGMAGAEMSIERYEVVAGFRHSIPARGALLRLSRFLVEPARVDEAITNMREGAVPRVKGADGLCSFQLLFNRDTGHGMVVSSWENRTAADAFWPVAEQLRARATEHAGVQFLDVENCSVIRTSVRLD